MSKSAVELIEKLEASGDFSPNQIKAMKVEIGPEFVEGSIYKRVAGKVNRSIGDLYIATSKLTGGFNMLNLTALDKSRTRTKFKPESFELVMDELDVDDLI